MCPYGVRILRTAALGGLRSFFGPTKGFAAFTGDCGTQIEILLTPETWTVAPAQQNNLPTICI
jgi:hypothetical protein